MISKPSSLCSYAIYNKSLYPTSWYVILRWIKTSGSKILQVVAHCLLVAIGSVVFILKNIHAMLRLQGQRCCIITPSQQLRIYSVTLMSSMTSKLRQPPRHANYLVTSNSDEVDVITLTYFNMISKSSLYSVHNKSLRFISWYESLNG